ncbi:Uncharacterized protein pbN1_08470 [Aromatoleum bremense]|nr:Uncharacterized protein pbN1_08470 [Aromatoleum bremense]
MPKLGRSGRDGWMFDTGRPRPPFRSRVARMQRSGIRERPTSVRRGLPRIPACGLHPGYGEAGPPHPCMAYVHCLKAITEMQRWTMGAIFAGMAAVAAIIKLV